MQHLKAWMWLCIFFSCGVKDNWSAEPEVRFNLLTLPTARQADLRLAMPARLNYEHASLRQCVMQLAERFQFSYWIDRRVDADKPIPRMAVEGSLRDCLNELAQASHAEFGLIENVVTIAQPENLAAMQYAAVRLHNQLSIVQAEGRSDTSSSTGQNNNAQMQPLAWPMLTTPSELAEQINNAWKLNLTVALPHDLMNAGKLQPCTVSTQLTLLYGGFNQCAAGKRLSELRLVAMPAAGNWQATYPSSLISADRIAAVKGAYADTRCEKAGSVWNVAGPTAAHLQLMQPAKQVSANNPSPRTPRSGNPSASGNDPLSKQRFDISKQADKPLGAILKNLGDQLGLSVEWDESLPPSAQQTLVTIEANKSKLDEILASLGTQAKLAITRTGTRISVTKSP